MWTKDCRWLEDTKNTLDTSFKIGQMKDVKRRLPCKDPLNWDGLQKLLMWQPRYAAVLGWSLSFPIKKHPSSSSSKHSIFPQLHSRFSTSQSLLTCKRNQPCMSFFFFFFFFFKYFMRWPFRIGYSLLVRCDLFKNLRFLEKLGWDCINSYEQLIHQN